MSADKKAIKIFIAYSQKDRTALDDLRTHAAPLLRPGNIQIWDDGEIIAGEVWDTTIKANLHEADIILLLLSPHALASEYFYNEEVKDALKRHEAGTARVVPVILAACLWQKTPLATLQGLPTGMTPISKWPNRDDAWNDVWTGLSDLIDELERLGFEQKTLEIAEAKPTAQPASKPSAAEEHAWEFAMEDDDRTAYEKFLIRFSDGFYAATARERLAAFEADDLLWELVIERGTEKAILKYLDKYPNGLHGAEAKQKIEAFDRERRELDSKKQKLVDATREKQELEKRERNHKAFMSSMRLIQIGLTKNEITERDPFYDLMIPIKGGTFEMGDTFGDGYDREKPVHTVTLSDFSLCKYPVTQGLWKAVMGESNNPSNFKGDESLPVEKVSWDDAQAFIATLNKKSGQQYRLPTEAEWEYAARGGGQSKGYKYSGSNNIEEVAWYKENAGNKTQPVGSLKPNELGLFDMSGNVWEWCQDRYDEKYYETCKKNGVVVNPTGPEKGVTRVIRGGGWLYGPRGCRAAYRGYGRPGYRDYDLGFRLALQFSG